VTAAVSERLANGSLFPGGRTRVEEQLQERLIAFFPAGERCHFLKTGSEAVAWAVRLARRSTGRLPVVRVGFHGWHDGLADGAVQWNDWDRAPVGLEIVPGSLDLRDFYLPASAHDLSIIVDLLLATPYAALLVDPIQLAEPGPDLSLLRMACDRSGAVLILDETKTAFRIAMGGVQQLTGVQADLTIAGKAMANGLPLSCVIGRTDLLGRAARAKGTFSSELSAIAASLATLAVMDEVEGCTRIAATGGQLIEGLNRVLLGHPAGKHLKAVAFRWPAMPHVHAKCDDAVAQRCRTEVLRDTAIGGALLLDKHTSFVGITHTAADVGFTTEAFAAALDSWLARQGS